jgi:hypothetical protein
MAGEDQFRYSASAGCFQILWDTLAAAEERQRLARTHGLRIGPKEPVSSSLVNGSRCNRKLSYESTTQVRSADFIAHDRTSCVSISLLAARKPANWYGMIHFAEEATVRTRTTPFRPFAVLDEKESERSMAKTVSVIGIEDKELRWIRSLILLLRHPDPSIPELARQALLYLTRSAAERPLQPARTLDQVG